MSELNETLNKRVSQLRDNLQGITKIVEQQKSQREQVFEHKIKEFQDLEAAFGQAIDQEIQSRKDGENKIIRLVDEKGSYIKSELN